MNEINKEINNQEKIKDITILEYISKSKWGPRYKYQCICGRISENTLYEIKKNKNICSIDSCGEFYILSKNNKYIGQKLNDITIIKYAGRNKDKKPIYQYQCICGRISETTIDALKRQENKCGILCGKTYYNQFIGQTIGNRKILNFDKINKSLYYFVQCKCNKISSIKISHLFNGLTQECRSCAARKYSINILKEGKSTWETWRAMKKRCYNPKSTGFYNYGKRGIKVCDRWLEDFQNFLDDMGIKPSKDSTIDRIDPDGNYEPSNCRWIDRKINSANTRFNKKNRDKYITIKKNRFM